VKPVADALEVARSSVIEQLGTKEQTAHPPRGLEADEALLARIRKITDARGSYGYRRVTSLLARDLDVPRANHKRVYRVMRSNGLLLARYTGKSSRTHDGVIITLKSNLRWCSDSFEIRCWNGERVQIAFSLDCCDREAMRWVATTAAITGEMIRDLMAESVEHRFGPGVMHVPHPLEWLSDNGPPYTANETRAFGESLGFLVCTTPAYSPESNGMAESFVKTFKRDYVYLNKLETAPTGDGAAPGLV
jgi:transposase InsO family protein